VVDEKRRTHPRDPELLAMKAVERGFSSARFFQRLVAAGQLLGRLGPRRLRFMPPPLSKWSATRDAPMPPATSFRHWFAATHPDGQVDSGAPRAADEPLVHRHDQLHDARPGHVGRDVPGREGVLSSLASALATRERHAVMPERNYRVTGSRDLDQRRELLKERLVDYRAQVVECDESSIGATINSLLVAHESRRVAFPADAPAGWRDHLDAEVRLDEPALSVEELDAIDSTVTGCAVAIAETGTLMLPAAPERPTTLNLLSDTFMVVLRASRIVGAYEEAWDLLRAENHDARSGGFMPRNVMLVTGPSRSADIESTLELGAHGPRRLHVLLVDDDPAALA
jgi:L-lactate utilization protein LutC